MNQAASVRSNDFRQKYGPWALILGASEGLGAAFAEALAIKKFNLVIAARRSELLEQSAVRLEKEFGIEVKPVTIDLAEMDAAARIDKETQTIDISLLVYNAAYSAVGAFLDQPIQEHLLEVDTNVRTPMQIVHYFGRRMAIRGRGGMILMSSLSAYQGSAFISNYSATKAFNLILAEGLWEEWRYHGVDILACMAGAIRTPNYVSSSPKKTGGLSDAAMEAESVVEAAFKALGQQPSLIPGGLNKISSFVMRHFLSRRASIRFMGSILRGMYVKE
jgi:uncharacterized protein